MRFRTELLPYAASFDINYRTPVLLVGSCFTEHIGAALAQVKIPTFINPFGIVYNPISIAESLQFLGTDETFTEKQLFDYQGLWHSWQHHGRFSGTQKAEVLRGINDTLNQARVFSQKASVLIITLGTAYVFTEKNTQRVVANCHKLPASRFDYHRLSVAAIEEALSAVFQPLFQKKENLNIILTVSPIRHIRNGLVENNLSKATLLLAVEGLRRRFEQVHYFPAYELVMDDLRDYRFYEADLIHPNGQAISYIWDFFVNTYFTDTTKEIAKEVGKITAMQQHRPLHGSDTEGYRQLQQTIQERINALTKKYPFISI